MQFSGKDILTEGSIQHVARGVVQKKRHMSQKKEHKVRRVTQKKRHVDYQEAHVLRGVVHKKHTNV